MGQTAHGYPWPDGTDPVASGDDAIKALADKIEADFLTGKASIGYDGAAANFSPAANTDTLINNWQTQSHKTGLAADIAYAAGLFTLAPGLWHAMFTVDWPSAAAAYRNRVLFYINGAAVTRGRESYQAVSGAGAQSLTGFWEGYMAAQFTLGAYINTSTAGLTGVAPLSIVVSRT